MVESITTKIIIYEGIIDKGPMKHLRKQGYLGVDPGSSFRMGAALQKSETVQKIFGENIDKKKEHKGDSG